MIRIEIKVKALDDGQILLDFGQFRKPHKFRPSEGCKIPIRVSLKVRRDRGVSTEVLYKEGEYYDNVSLSSNARIDTLQGLHTGNEVVYEAVKKISELFQQGHKFRDFFDNHDSTRGEVIKTFALSDTSLFDIVELCDNFQTFYYSLRAMAYLRRNTDGRKILAKVYSNDAADGYYVVLNQAELEELQDTIARFNQEKMIKKLSNAARRLV